MVGVAPWSSGVAYGTMERVESTHAALCWLRPTPNVALLALLVVLAPHSVAGVHVGAQPPASVPARFLVISETVSTGPLEIVVTHRGTRRHVMACRTTLTGDSPMRCSNDPVPHPREGDFVVVARYDTNTTRPRRDEARVEYVVPAQATELKLTLLLMERGDPSYVQMVLDVEAATPAPAQLRLQPSGESWPDGEPFWVLHNGTAQEFHPSGSGGFNGRVLREAPDGLVPARRARGCGMDVPIPLASGETESVRADGVGLVDPLAPGSYVLQLDVRTAPAPSATVRASYARQETQWSLRHRLQAPFVIAR